MPENYSECYKYSFTSIYKANQEESYSGKKVVITGINADDSRVVIGQYNILPVDISSANIVTQKIDYFYIHPIEINLSFIQSTVNIM